MREASLQAHARAAALTHAPSELQSHGPALLPLLPPPPLLLPPLPLPPPLALEGAGEDGAVGVLLAGGPGLDAAAVALHGGARSCPIRSCGTYTCSTANHDPSRWACCRPGWLGACA